MKPISRRALVGSLFALAPDALAAEVVLSATRDNTMYAESGNESNGSGTFFFAGTNGFGDARRALVRFDVAAGVPAGSTITHVELTLYMSKTNSGPRQVRLHRVLADWGEGTERRQRRGRWRERRDERRHVDALLLGSSGFRVGRELSSRPSRASYLPGA